MAGIIIGIDEVGRGPWAGPVVAAAVAMPTGLKIRGVKDSKLLQRQQREAILPKIRQLATGIGIGWAPHNEVDELGLTQAVRLAMLRAIQSLDIWSEHIVIDGNINYLKADYPLAQALIKADARVQCVAAASIVAKVARDNYMCRLASLYPKYGFAKHVGYGTSEHIRRLSELGPTPLHRLSFRPIWQNLALAQA